MLRETISSIAVSDTDTLNTIKAVFEEFQYILDPHAAVAYGALKAHLLKKPEQKGFILGTAHPVKFPSVVKTAIGHEPIIPEVLVALMKKKKNARLIPPEYASFKSATLEILKSV